MNNLSFTELCDRYQTDKGLSFGEAHGYSLFYDILFKELREKASNILEVGLKVHTHNENSDLNERVITSCSSIECLLDYFPNAVVHGVDLSEKVNFSNERFVYHRADQGDKENLLNLARKLPKLDLIIDDGSHATFHQLLTFVCLFDKLENGAVYFIEDLYWQPPYPAPIFSDSTYSIFSKIASGKSFFTGNEFLDSKLEQFLPDIGSIVCLNVGLTTTNAPSLLVIQKRENSNVYTNQLKLKINNLKALFRSGEYSKVINIAKEVTDFGLFQQDVLLVLSRCYMALGDAKSALESINSYYQIDVDSRYLDEDMDVLHVDALLNAGNSTESVEKLQRLVSVFKSNEYLKVKLIKLKVQYSLIDSISEFDQDVREIKTPHLVREMQTLKLDLMYKKQMFQEIIALMKAEEYSWHQKDSYTLMLKGAVYNELGDLVKSEQILSESISKSPYQEESYINLGRVKYLRRDYEGLFDTLVQFENYLKHGTSTKELKVLASMQLGLPICLELIDSIDDYSEIYFKKDFFGVLLALYTNEGRASEAAEILRRFYF